MPSTFPAPLCRISSKTDFILLALHVSSDTHVDTSLPPWAVKPPHFSWCNECEEDTSCIKYFLAKLKLQKTKLSDSLFGHDLSSF